MTDYLYVPVFYMLDIGQKAIDLMFPVYVIPMKKRVSINKGVFLRYDIITPGYANVDSIIISSYTNSMNIDTGLCRC